MVNLVLLRRTTCGEWFQHLSWRHSHTRFLKVSHPWQPRPSSITQVSDVLLLDWCSSLVILLVQWSRCQRKSALPFISDKFSGARLRYVDFCCHSSYTLTETRNERITSDFIKQTIILNRGRRLWLPEATYLSENLNSKSCIIYTVMSQAKRRAENAPLSKWFCQYFEWVTFGKR